LALVVIAWAAIKYRESSLSINWSIANTPPRGVKILLVGDESAAFVKDLARQKTDPYIFLDMSKQGQQLSTIDADVVIETIQNANAHALVISAGIYDLSSGVSWNKIWKQFEDLVAKVKAENIPIVFLGLTPPGMDNFPFGFQDVCKKNGILLVNDVLNGLWLENIKQSLELMGNQNVKAQIASKTREAISFLY